MNSNPFSYNEILAIVDLVVGILKHTRLEPDAEHIRLLGINQVARILEMTYPEKISLIKEVVEFL
ncbi:hypothetical protein Anacy_2184 [Anabaena cylindrica PCC 7122]|uniref:Uncharacterized protein n=1 Tax=Anabaena cylindrica (strain ATCC 27899 / PCC 7122) TaxID=272123 RepID=K9ZEL0_ANACC|nr:hypothetical protein Anacy_2184 [Anabaena cylindrica PCC 7122]AZL96679.1 hypothetical protein [Anabaena sp. CCAP 1446/1C]BAY05397.1 hypothetical protein NIES19_46700 [Anabaena cylindrica PCC 7122]